MTAGCAASRRVLARTPVAPLPASSPKTPDGHQRENVRSARDVSPRSVQFSVAKSVQFSVAIDNKHRRPEERPFARTPRLGKGRRAHWRCVSER